MAGVTVTTARSPTVIFVGAKTASAVAKVDELMMLCDRLEASLTRAADTRRQLLDALVAEALASDDARELEAATAGA